jgi:hypothetical protein
VVVQRGIPWKKNLSVTGVGPFLLLGQIGPQVMPQAGNVACNLDALAAMTCVDATGKVWQLISATAAANVLRRHCDLVVGSRSGAVVAAAQLSEPRLCLVDAPGTVSEVDVESDVGSPGIQVAVRHCAAGVNGTCSSETISNLTSSPVLSSNGMRGCSGPSVGLDGISQCSATIQNVALQAGDEVELVGGTPDVAHLITVHVYYIIGH